MADEDRHFWPGATQREFIICPKPIVLCQSSFGEGKTSGAIQAMVVDALLGPPEEWPVRWAVIRDTRKNIGMSTAGTIKEWYPEGDSSRWRGKEEEPESCRIRVRVREHAPRVDVVECVFFGVANEADLSVLQSTQFDRAWIEEPAPAAALSGGISAEVFAMLRMRLRMAKKPRLQMTFNPPPPEHWLVRLWPELSEHPEDVPEPESEKERMAVARIRADTEVFKIPVGENTYLREGARQENEDSLVAIGRPDLVARLVKGTVGAIQQGVAVVPEFKELDHVIPALAGAKVGEVLTLSWDGGQHPSCVICRILPGRPLEVLAAFQGNNVGMRQFLQQQVLPWMAVWVPRGVVWDHTGDPNLTNPAESDKEETALSVLQELLRGRTWTPGPVSVDDRREPVHEQMYRGGRPGVKIDRRWGKPLIDALSGGWHYRRDSSGTVVQEVWVKNLSANTGEAFAYLCALVGKRVGYTRQMQNWRDRQRRSVTGVITRTGV